jgi:hypothetical protein
MRSCKCLGHVNKLSTLKYNCPSNVVIQNTLILNIMHNVSNYARTIYCLVVIIPTSYQKLIHLRYSPEVISVLLLSLLGTCFNVKLSYALIKSEDVCFQKKMFILSSVTCLFYLTRKYKTKYGKH